MFTHAQNNTVTEHVHTNTKQHNNRHVHIKTKQQSNRTCSHKFIFPKDTYGAQEGT